MSKWKDLGEVPDSEDESIDSGESQQEQPADLEKEDGGPTDELPTAVEVDDIWGIPSSPPRPIHRLLRAPEAGTTDPIPVVPTSPSSSPLSPPPDEEDYEEATGAPSSSLAQLISGNLPGKPTHDNPPSGSSPLSDDELATPQLRITTASSPPRSSSGQAIASIRPPSPERSVNGAGTRVPPQGTLTQDADLEFSRALMQAERSLRPRKPIQQHPYLLENAQYSSFMKSHGVRPLRVTAEPASQRPSVGEDSQDQEFEASGSQELAADGPTGETDESQPLLFDDAADDRDILALSPSPPRSSPPRANPQTSSQQANGDQTDDTSVMEEDFPSLDDLVRKLGKTPGRGLKRYRSSRLLSSRKRSKAQISSPPVPSSLSTLLRPDLWGTPSMSPEPTTMPDQSQDLGNTPLPSQPRRVRSPFRRIPDEIPSPEGTKPPNVVDLTVQDEGDSSSDSEASSSSSGSRSGSDVVERNRRRIRGVLPASYLRVVQQSGRDTARTNRRSPDRSPGRGPRRGVALPKPSNPKPSPSIPFFFNDSDDDNDNNEPSTKPMEQRENRRDLALDLLFDNDGDSSAMEDDHIDMMLFRNKRSSAPSGGLPRPKKRKTTKQSAFKAPQGQKTRQPTIAQALSRSQTTTQDNPVRRPRPSSRKRQRPTKLAKPPLLSILDVVEPKAPQFIKVAARTARRNKNLGKASPTRKHIDLGTRRDNVDARSVLHDWRAGKIRPKIPYSAPKANYQAKRQPLGELCANSATPPSSTPPGSPYPKPPNLARQPRVLGQVAADAASIRGKPQRIRSQALIPRPSARPAQLEVAEHQRPETAGFVAKKRALDALYWKARKNRTVSVASHLDRLSDRGPSSVEARRQGDDDHGTEAAISPRPPQSNNGKSRFRKRVAPRHVDLDAPHFTHANDPLPENTFFAQETEEPRSQDKLIGLGPYGTHYTQHFEVFPLDHGVFFHETTIIGRGILSKLLEPSYLDKVRQTRPRASFVMDGRTLRWGPWDDTTSSELGILVDWIIEQFPQPTTSEGSPSLGRSIEGSEFILHYVIDSISFADDGALKSFVARTVEVFQGLCTRIEELSSTIAIPEATRKTHIEILTCSIVTILAAYQLNQGVGSNFSVNIQLEALLTTVARQCIKMLLGIGLESLRVLYGELQQLSSRERGIRRGHTAANSLVILIRVLESACIPRSSFWDITQSVMMTPDIISGTEANKFEDLWRDTFTLLPLCEFDNSGILTVGMRHIAPIEGWTLPQQVLKRVFQLYTNNPRQGPNFNEYCRALAARCHYLVQQWGWRKCSGIIGTMFDFFGSQNLAHLRNEEVYKSPQFLENLAHNPSLAIEPEDRCFHIFLKTLGLVILRLKRLDLTKDIKNLIARTLPNHSRQLLKENVVRQQDLAALRNHHDLLCTLFWAAPPALRPGVHLIEKLVVPGSSHKEACLINLRAWSQLARFVVSSGEGGAAFRPFMAWQTSIFQQLLDQYRSVASDIQQQFLALSKDGPGLSNEVASSMIKKNKAAAMDVLYLSIKASLDVLKLAGTLGTATSSLNIYQLQQTFTQLDFSSPDFDWGIVLIATETLELYISKVEQAAEAQYSSDSTNMSDPQEVEEAILLLDHRVAEQYFFMTRTLLELPNSAFSRSPGEQGRCVEKTVTLAARMACRFIHSGITRTVNYFTSRKYGLFRGLPAKLNSPQRTYLPLFLATLIKNHIFDFKDVGPSLLGLWLLTIVKPQQSLGYENYLATTLKQKNIPYLQRAVIPAGIEPDYNSNREFFAAGLSFMRKDLRDINVAQTKPRRDEHAKCLQLAMQKMKEDLGTLKSNSAEHKRYMEFVREIIALIKSHGVGICVVDPFFTQPSADYSPPMQDPQLHTAGIVAYGVRLGEGEATAAPQLFHYLYNNFKIALANDKLHEECSILEHAMGNQHVLSFMLSRVLPAVTWATAKVNEAWPLLDVYVGALRNLLTRSSVPKEIAEDSMEDVSELLKIILAWFRTLQASNQPSLSTTQLHIMVRLTELASLFSPSLTTHFYSQPHSDIAGLADLATSFGKFAEETSTHLNDMLDVANLGVMIAAGLQTRHLLAGIEDGGQGLVFQSGREMNPQVDNFANVIVADVSKNWAVTATSISWNTPGRGAGLPPTQSGPGTRYEFQSWSDSVRQLRRQLSVWRDGKGVKNRRRGRKARLKGAELLIF